MMKLKFSILSAYEVSFKVMLEHASFYLVWSLVVALFDMIYFIGLCLYLHIIDATAVLHNISSMKDVLYGAYIHNSIGSFKQYDGSIYKLLQKLLPHSWLNHTLEIMSWAEYYNVIVAPRLIPLIIILTISAFLMMSMSIGYIKTALAAQDKKPISLHDLYRHYYLVPHFFATKIIVVLVVVLPIIVWFLSMVVAEMVLPDATFLLAMIIKAISFIVAVVYSVLISQRLRFASYFVIDQHMSPVQACMSSWHVTQGLVWRLMLFGSIFSVLMVIGKSSGLIIVIGMMIYRQATVNVYRQLIHQK